MDERTMPPSEHEELAQWCEEKSERHKRIGAASDPTVDSPYHQDHRIYAKHLARIAKILRSQSEPPAGTLRDGGQQWRPYSESCLQLQHGSYLLRVYTNYAGRWCWKIVREEVMVELHAQIATHNTREQAQEEVLAYVGVHKLEYK